MKRHPRSSLLATIAGLLFLFLAPAGAAVSSAQVEAPIGVSSSLAKAARAVHFAEPLVATSIPTNADDQALSQALNSYNRRTTPESVDALLAFLKSHPHSPWAAALFTNIGIFDLHYGYFSRALDAWKKAWAAGKNAEDPQARALVDRAVGELARLYASLGKNKELAALFVEIGHRPISGSATESVQTAREELTLAHKDPRHLFICGPLALLSLMQAEGATPDQVDFLRWYHAGPNGTNLAEIGRLADKVKFAHAVVFRKPGQAIPVPSVVHWKVGHFAAIVGQRNGFFHVIDTVFPSNNVWMTRTAIDAEASGYFLVPSSSKAKSEGWRLVANAEAEKIWGKGPTSGTTPGTSGPQDPPANPPVWPFGSPLGSGGAGGSGGSGGSGGPGPNGACPLCAYNIGESTVSLSLSDVPVGYSPPVGPSAKVQIFYNQREDSQPANFSFFNVSPKWTMNWLTYITDDPSNPGASVSRYIAGGGAYYYTGYQSTSGKFAPQNNDGSILVLASQSPVTYRRQLGDGSVEIYAQSDGAASYPRHIFLSKVIDPQGNTLTLNYDNQERLVSLTDAAGRQTTFTYGLASRPLLITKITDPFGRSAELTYDSSGRLSSITDVIGLTSSFTYDANSLVNSMTTPYGTTTFSYTAPGTSGPPRFVQVTDPMGYSEREEWLEPAPIPDSDPSNTVPTGMPVAPTNQYLTYRDSFHWDKSQYIAAGCTPTGGCDYTKARDRHFAHDASNTNEKSTTIESVKYPLENRIWFNYPGQTQSIYSGTNTQPTAVARVLDDGTTQLSQTSYDTGGYYKITQQIDPTGRITSYSYSNHIDLNAVSQTTQYGVQQTLAQFIYNTKHRPIYYTDAAGETTTYSYNTAGQVTAVTNPLGQKTSYQYNSTGDLVAIINANNQTAESFTYDNFDRIRTTTDSEGYTLTYDYDAANRVTKITYPDGTTDVYTYDKLDLASYRDREGRIWNYTYDADRRLTSITDPTGQKTSFDYNPDGQLASLTDPNNNVTHWAYDIEGRLITKTFADNSTVTYTYENTTSRLKSVLDALGQTKQFAYGPDNRLTGITYLNAINPTANVTFAYDPYFPRLLSMTDGTGTTEYSYFPVGSLGALQLQEQGGPLPNDTEDFTYDELGRIASRTVSGAGTETFGYDAIGRLVSHGSDLGQFTLSYLGQTGQITQRQLANSTLATTWSYLPNAQDRRLAGVDNIGLSSGQYTDFQFTTTPENFITNITQTSDASAAYPATSSQTATYNNLNQLTDLSGQALTYDADGNLTSDGQRNYTWDAENRLIGITYPGQPGKQTSFTYNGLSQRVAITNTPAGGGSAVTTSYVWCGSRPCQARDSTNAVTREYLTEGEFVPGSPAQTYYYGVDQIGSVRRVFASASNAPTYDYDPYGNALQATAPPTDFGYAGMFYNADSGINLTQFRAYNPVIGRWLSRDPLGAGNMALANLYIYAGNDPLFLDDQLGLICGNPLTPLLNAIANNPWLLPLIAATEAAGAGPEDPLADAAVAEEIELAESIAGSAQSAATAPALADQLAFESANSAFAADNTLTPEAIANSREIIPSTDIANPEVPPGFSKFSTQTYQSPSGNFQVHFYMNPSTSETFYDLDYKAVFNGGR